MSAPWDAPAVGVHQLTRRFGDGPAVLDRLDLEIAPGETIALKPEGMHIMLTGLAAALRENETVPITLIFENAEPVTVDAIVEPTRATKARARPNP